MIGPLELAVYIAAVIVIIIILVNFRLGPDDEDGSPSLRRCWFIAGWELAQRGKGNEENVRFAMRQALWEKNPRETWWSGVPVRRKR